MSNDNKTLADAQPGGRVRLGDGLPSVSAQWLPIRFAPHDTRIICAWLGAPGCSEVDLGYYFTDHPGEPYWCSPSDINERFGEPHLWQPFPTLGEVGLEAALSAQPSLGGQNALATALEVFERRRADIPYEVYEQVKAVCAALAASQPVGQAPVAWQTMASCPRDGTAILLRWGEDHVSPGWWCADASPIQNEDGTWSSDNGGFPWAFFDLNDGVAFVNHAVDTEHGPTHWAPYVYLPAQAVDLGQFRPMVQMYVEANEKIEHLSDVAAWAVGHGKRLLALIDSQAVGK